MIRLIAICATMFALTACETTKGVGRDLGKAAGAIQDAAADTQAKM
jgi:predicted small secreted protein